MASHWRTPAFVRLGYFLGASAQAAAEDHAALNDPALYQATEFHRQRPLRFAELDEELEARLGELRGVVDTDVAAFNDLVKRKGASAIFVTGS